MVTSFVAALFALGYSICEGRFENVALRKTCSHSSSYIFSPTSVQYPADYAVNGNTDGTYSDTSANCIHTATSDTSPWWQVDLGRPYPVYNITVWARAEFISRMSNRFIMVDGKECYRFGALGNTSSRQLTITCRQGTLNGTVVRLTRDAGSAGDELAIQMCEFQVFSCSALYWGSGCAQDCGKCSGGAACDKVTGECQCEAGWMPPLCKECVAGKWGDLCDKSCTGQCGGDQACDRQSGLCLQGCMPGFWGPFCNQSCASTCAGKSCDKTSGQCPSGCLAGWWGVACTRTCSDRCGGDRACDRNTGQCPQGCVSGWWGRACDQSCPRTCIIDGSCGQSTEDCIQLCAAGWTGDFCNMSCPNTCGGDKSCDRNRGTCLQGCADGFWDGRCDKPCRITCGQNGACERNSSTCLHFCQPEWAWVPLCNIKCEPGRYGINCSLTCGHCSNDETCRHDNGHCDNGCQGGYEGYRCQKPTAVSGEVSVWPIVGSVLGVGVAIVVAVVLSAWWIRRSRDQQRTISTDTLHNASSEQSCETQLSNVAVTDSAKNTTYENCEDPASNYDKLQVTYENTAEDKPYAELNAR